MDEDMPMDTSRDVFYFNEGALAYAGYHVHEEFHPLHTHSFVEIAFAVGGSGTHHCLAGRQKLIPGAAVLLRPGVWHGYEECRRLELYNCCFSSELLRRELSWTREDPVLGYLLWTGPYSAPGKGVLTMSLDKQSFEDCQAHMHALAALRYRSPQRYRADIIGHLTLLLGRLGQAVDQVRPAQSAEPGPAHPVVGRAMRMLEADVARRWTLTGLADELHVAPGYLVRLFKSAAGLPPMAYLAQVRAEHAAVMLLDSSQPIMSIAREVGWPDQNYFARRFKAHYGLSATTYRERFATRAMHLPEG
jgi:AraC family transcriptional regulator, L-rhamnose operon transcriptional activator RhaR